MLAGYCVKSSREASLGILTGSRIRFSAIVTINGGFEAANCVQRSLPSVSCGIGSIRVGCKGNSLAWRANCCRVSIERRTDKIS